MAQLEHIDAIERRLWEAADTLRANSPYASNEYFLPVMGLVFLRHAYSRYLAVKDKVEASLPTRGGRKRAPTREDYSRQSAIFLRPEAQFDYLVGLPDGEDRAKAIIAAMDSIEADYDSLRGALPKAEYQELDNDVLGQLLRTLNPDELDRNPLRADFQRHYERIVADYNREKDRVTIEQTFEELLRFVGDLDREEERAVRQGLDEESLAIFDLLQKPDLGARDIDRIKMVSTELLRTLKEGKLRVEQWREKEATRAAVKGEIHDFLWSDVTGLPPDSYTDEDVQVRVDDVFRNVHRVYPTVPSPIYMSDAA